MNEDQYQTIVQHVCDHGHAGHNVQAFFNQVSTPCSCISLRRIEKDPPGVGEAAGWWVHHRPVRVEIARALGVYGVVSGHDEVLCISDTLSQNTHPPGNLGAIVLAARRLKSSRRGKQALGPTADIDELISSGNTRCWSPSSGPRKS